MDLSIWLRGGTFKKGFAPLAKKRLRGATVPLGMSVASPAKKGSVAQLYSALDFGSSGCRLESCRGHSSGDLIIINRISAFYFC